jgi:hypothetical protein
MAMTDGASTAALMKRTEASVVEKRSSSIVARQSTTTGRASVRFPTVVR